MTAMELAFAMMSLVAAYGGSQFGEILLDRYGL